MKNIDAALDACGIPNDIQDGEARLIREFISELNNKFYHLGLSKEAASFIVQFLINEVQGEEIPNFKDLCQSLRDQIIGLNSDLRDCLSRLSETTQRYLEESQKLQAQNVATENLSAILNQTSEDLQAANHKNQELTGDVEDLRSQLAKLTPQDEEVASGE